MSADVIEAIMRAGAGRARRRAENVAVAGAAAVADELPGVRAVVDGSSIRLSGGGVRARAARGDWRIAAWIERVREIAGARR